MARRPRPGRAPLSAKTVTPIRSLEEPLTHRVGRMVRVAWDGDDDAGGFLVALHRAERRNAVDHATLLGLVFTGA